MTHEGYKALLIQSARSHAEDIRRYDDDSRDLVDTLVEMANVLAEEPELSTFFAWADKSNAVTWTGKLGLKERWLNKDNPEYQQMLKDRGE